MLCQNRTDIYGIVNQIIKINNLKKLINQTL